MEAEESEYVRGLNDGCVFDYYEAERLGIKVMADFIRDNGVIAAMSDEQMKKWGLPPIDWGGR